METQSIKKRNSIQYFIVIYDGFCFFLVAGSCQCQQILLKKTDNHKYDSYSDC